MVKYTNGIEINGNGRKHKSSDVNYTRLDSGYISYNRIIQSNTKWTNAIYQVSQKNVPLGEVCPSPKGTFFLGHPVHVCIMLDYAIGWLISPSKKLSYIFLLGEKLKF